MQCVFEKQLRQILGRRVVETIAASHVTRYEEFEILVLLANEKSRPCSCLKHEK